jgi:hypothetical protein
MTFTCQNEGVLLPPPITNFLDILCILYEEASLYVCIARQQFQKTNTGCSS